MLTMMWSMPMMMMISDEMLKKELRDIESLLWLMHKIRFFLLYIYLISDDKSVYVKKIFDQILIFNENVLFETTKAVSVRIHFTVFIKYHIEFRQKY